MSAPAILIVIELERKAPALRWNCMHLEDEERLIVWLTSQPKLLDLVVSAAGLREAT